MNKKAFIFIGRSGSGKGTQARLLQECLKDIEREKDIIYLETGEEFRHFLKEDGYTQTLSRKIMDEGKLQPDFLAILMWSRKMIDTVKEDVHLILDGTPRQLREAYVLEKALEFYNYKDIHIIYPNVSRTWSEERLMARGRSDDKDPGDIKARLDWYDSQVNPVVEYYRSNPMYKFHDINGEQSIENVHKEVKEKTGLENGN